MDKPCALHTSLFLHPGEGVGHAVPECFGTSPPNKGIAPREGSAASQSLTPQRVSPEMPPEMLVQQKGRPEGLAALLFAPASGTAPQPSLDFHDPGILQAPGAFSCRMGSLCGVPLRALGTGCGLCACAESSCPPSFIAFLRKGLGARCTSSRSFLFLLFLPPSLSASSDPGSLFYSTGKSVTVVTCFRARDLLGSTRELLQSSVRLFDTFAASWAHGPPSWRDSSRLLLYSP